MGLVASATSAGVDVKAVENPGKITKEKQEYLEVKSKKTGLEKSLTLLKTRFNVTMREYAQRKANLGKIIEGLKSDLIGVSK